MSNNIMINYGIDLGTTNSAISRIEKGKSIIKKNDQQMDTTPSCVHFNKKKAVRIGMQAKQMLRKETIKAVVENDTSLINGFEEFKRTMGTDEVYKSSNMQKDFTSEELSAEILKGLKISIQDEDVRSAVITVPAMFTGIQKDATLRAAELAGIEHAILVDEPVAASMAYGLSEDMVDGKWLVFDFGGGTFDVALMGSEDGIISTIDTQGDNFLGGKNIDRTIVDKLIIPYLKKEYKITKLLKNKKKGGILKHALKKEAENIKINFSPKQTETYEVFIEDALDGILDDDKKQIELEFSISRKQYEKVVKPIFKKAVDISLNLLKNNKVKGDDLTTILLIGGPTYQNTLREMIKTQITKNINTSMDPMTAVASGAAMIASTKRRPDFGDEEEKSKDSIPLKLFYEPDSVESQAKVGIVLEGENDTKFFIEITRYDDAWKSDKIEFLKDAMFDVELNKGESNEFNIKITNEKAKKINCHPDTFTIIQGIKMAAAQLNNNLCIEIFNESKGEALLRNFKGLEKNQPLPTQGNATFKTREKIRPGKKEDKIIIPVYEGNENYPANTGNYRGTLTIDGTDLPGLLPEKSDIDIYLSVNESNSVKVIAEIPFLDDYEKETLLDLDKILAPDADYLIKQVKSMLNQLNKIQEEYPDSNEDEIQKIKDELNVLIESLDENSEDSEFRLQTQSNIKKIYSKMHEIQLKNEWPKVKGELEEAMEALDETINQFAPDNDKVKEVYIEMEASVQNVINEKNTRMGLTLIASIRQLSFTITEQAAGLPMMIGVIKNFDENFDSMEWKNPQKARTLIDQAKNMIHADATKENLKHKVTEIFSCMEQPTSDNKGGPGGLVGG